jgi:hypothetical protein
MKYKAGDMFITIHAEAIIEIVGIDILNNKYEIKEHLGNGEKVKWKDRDETEIDNWKKISPLLMAFYK